MENELVVYKCNMCGETVEILNGECRSLTCCGQDMVEVIANTVDAATEKHVPTYTVEGDLLIVKVGEVIHPMDEDHYIQWIAHVHDNRVCRVNLKPGDEPVAKFAYKPGAKIYAMCNKHGLWSADVK